MAVLVSAWMLDPAACAGMRLGDPHASIEALVDLDRLLTEHGLRRSLDGAMTSPGRIVVRNALRLSACLRPPRQLSMSLDSMELKGMSKAERAAAVSQLAKHGEPQHRRVREGLLQPHERH